MRRAAREREGRGREMSPTSLGNDIGAKCAHKQLVLRPLCVGIPCANIASGVATLIVRDWNHLAERVVGD